MFFVHQGDWKVSNVKSKAWLGMYNDICTWFIYDYHIYAYTLVIYHHTMLHIGL